VMVSSTCTNTGYMMSTWVTGMGLAEVAS